MILSVIRHLAALALFAASHGTRQHEGAPTLVNPSFEQGDPDVIEGWWIHPEPQGFSARILAGAAWQGSRFVRVENPPGESRSTDVYLYQTIDAVALRGQRLRIRGALRVDGAYRISAVHLWARVWRTHDLPGETFDLADQPVLQDEWEPRSLLVDVPADALTVQVGFKTVGFGTADADGFGVDVVGPSRESEGPRPLAGRELDNVLAFTRLLGLVRHFHPADEVEDLDWSGFTIDALRRVEGCVDAVALASTLQALFAPFAPTVQVFPTGDEPGRPSALLRPEGADAIEVVTWDHYGYGHRSGGFYHSERVHHLLEDGEWPEGLADPAEPYELALSGGVTCRVPLALYAVDGAVVPAGAELPVYDVLERVNDRACRLAAVALGWNVLQHFFPYFDLVGYRWDEALVEALGSAAEDLERADFRRTLERMTSWLKDGHAWVTDPFRSERRVLPLAWAWIEDQLIVTRVADATRADLPRAGDRVLRIGELGVRDAIAARERMLSASHPAALRTRALQDLLAGPPNVRLWLEVESPGGERRRVGPPYEGLAVLPESRPEVLDEVAPGVWYVDLDRADGETLTAALDTLAAANGLVFDLRGYPRTMECFIPSFLTDEPMQSPTWAPPRIARPDRQAVAFEGSSWPALAAKPRLAAPTVFLTDARAQSAAETYLSFVEHYRLAEIVGAPTAGTNGNVNPFRVPGGFRISWTGMRVFKQDGSEHHGVGVRPTVEVQRSRQAVLEGRDEFLEAALELIDAAVREGRGAGVVPRTAGDFLHAAELALRSNESGAVLEAATRAIELAPSASRGYLLRARAHLRLHEDERALTDLDHALEVAPDDPETRLHRGLARYGVGDVEGARRDVGFAFEHEHTRLQAALDLARLELAEDEPDRVLELADLVLDLDRRSGQAHLLRFAALDARGERQAAAEELARAGRIWRREPSDVPLFTWLGYRDAGENETAVRVLETAHFKWVGKQEGEWLADGAAFLLGRRDEAEWFAQTDPQRHSWASFWAGAQHELDGDVEGARRLYERCLAARDWKRLTHACARTRLARLR